MDNWNTHVDHEDTRKILRMCAKCLPALANVHHGLVQVGLRPHRDAGVRLEYEKNDAQMNIIHCYGHSGSGVTLSWGCAKDVIEIVQKLFPYRTASSDLPEHEQLWRLKEKRIVIRANL